MSGITLTVDTREMMALFARLEERLKDTTPLMQRIGRALHSSTKTRFQTQTAPDGSRWKPSRRAIREGGQTLVKTSRLRNSITWSADATRALIGTNVQYAAIHQTGGTVGIPARVMPHGKKGRYISRSAAGQAEGSVRISFSSARKVEMPARPFLGVSREDWEHIANIVREYLS
jgi:phage virion morphogenesis protein